MDGEVQNIEVIDKGAVQVEEIPEEQDEANAPPGDFAGETDQKVIEQSADVDPAEQGDPTSILHETEKVEDVEPGDHNLEHGELGLAHMDFLQ